MNNEGQKIYNSKNLHIFAPQNFADVAKLVDALDLGSSAFGHEGSSPSIRTSITAKPPSSWC